MRRVAALSMFALWTMGFGAAPSWAQMAYITNSGSVQGVPPLRTFVPGTTVSVIATATNTVVSTITVGSQPNGVAITPDGSKVYVTNSNSNTVSVITTATNAVVSTITVGRLPDGIAVTPDGSKVYVANILDDTISVIATATNTVVGSPIAVGNAPNGVAVTPDGTTGYVANSGSNTVSVIATRPTRSSATQSPSAPTPSAWR
jgi:YVTN family beta-propeller protein